MILESVISTSSLIQWPEQIPMQMFVLFFFCSVSPQFWPLLISLCSRPSPSLRVQWIPARLHVSLRSSPFHVRLWLVSLLILRWMVGSRLVKWTTVLRYFELFVQIYSWFITFFFQHLAGNVYSDKPHSLCIVIVAASTPSTDCSGLGVSHTNDFSPWHFLAEKLSEVRRFSIFKPLLS